MTNQFDPTTTQQRYELIDDADLIKIAYSPESSHIPEAITLAKNELLKRGISESEPVVMSTIASVQGADCRPENIPLSIPMRVFCFILTPLPALIVALWQFFSGRRRAAKDALTWMFFGFVFWIFLKNLIRSIAA